MAITKDGFMVSVLAWILGLVLSSAGCGSVSRTVDRDYGATVSLEGLEEDLGERPSLVFRRPGAPGLAAYDRFIVGPVVVDYRDAEMVDLPIEEVNRIEDTLESAVVRELRGAGYEVGTKVTPGTLRMSFAVSGFSAPKEGGALNMAALAGGAVIGAPGVSISVG
ncbi:MAG: DUF3313 family protein [Planctomycetota bacterium]